MVSTVVIIFIIVLFTILGVRRGAARTLLNLAAAVIATMISNVLANVTAQAVYTAFIRPEVLRSIEGTIAKSGEQFAAHNSLQSLPDGFEGLVTAMARLVGATPEQLQGSLALSPGTTQQAALAIEKPVGELATLALALLISFVYFIIILMLLKLLMRPLLRVFEVPVVRRVNSVIGGILGFVEGVVLSFAATNLVYLFMSYANPAPLQNSGLFGGLFNALVIFR